ncbi:cupin domain-containing protein, partial [Flavobacterium sp.]|uniref:JmjC domain-containing protein n=1 Tax=Flavobacterium sp. TaxID=239 RepID=UPI0025BE403E
TFIGEHFESNSLFKKENPGVGSLLKMERFSDFDNILFRYIEHSELVRIADKGNTFPAPRLRNGKLNISALLDKYYNGNSIVFNSIFRFDKEIKKITEMLGASLASTVQANLYLTPANGQAFATHYDAHDVIVIQLVGRKSWHIYNKPDGLLFPISIDRSLTPERLEESKLSHNLDFDVGSTLYLPRGFPHKAVSQNQPSLHITFSLAPYTSGDVLKQFVDIIQNVNPVFRKNFSPSLLELDDFSAVFSDIQKVLEEAFSNEDLKNELVFQMKRKLVEDVSFLPASFIDGDINHYEFIKFVDRAHFDFLEKDSKYRVSNFQEEILISESEYLIFQALVEQRRFAITEILTVLGDSGKKFIYSLISLGIAEFDSRH